MKGINEFYGHIWTTVLLVDTELPEGPKTNSKQYIKRGWCLMECMFADASKTPRYIFTKNNQLEQLRADCRDDALRAAVRGVAASLVTKNSGAGAFGAGS